MSGKCDNVIVLIAGRYNKFGRNISQTPWVIDGNKKVANSVEEYIRDAFTSFCPSERTKFSASGREDVDVQMLGKGRPFVFELCNPQNAICLGPEVFAQMRHKVMTLSQEKVLVRDLQVITRKDMRENLKEGQEEKTKQYMAHCCSNLPITQQEMDTFNESFIPMDIDQLTPIRVLHRRTAINRKRRVEGMKLMKDDTDENKFYLRVITEAGTYVKELVHGDFCRTQPSLGQLINKPGLILDIITLDVEEIITDWPPSIEEPNPIVITREEDDAHSSNKRFKGNHDNLMIVTS